jgi:hypothetical protein
MGYKLVYRKAVQVPDETRQCCPCRCAPSSIVTSTGIRLHLSMEDGERFPAGTYHVRCEPCEQDRPPRPPELSQRDQDRGRLVCKPRAAASATAPR